MFNPINPQDPTPDISGQLKKYGMKMNKKTSPGKSNDPIGNMGGKVNLNNEGNPNSKSSYGGIFGY